MRLVVAAPGREELTCKETRCYAAVCSCLTSDSTRVSGNKARDLARNVHIC